MLRVRLLLSIAVALVAMLPGLSFAQAPSAQHPHGAGRPTPVPSKITEGQLPGGTLGKQSSEIWKKLREGERGAINIPDEKAAQLIRGRAKRLNTEADIRRAMELRRQQSDAADTGNIASWVEYRKGPLARYGAYGMLGMLALLVVFYFVRGPVRIEHGKSGRVIDRFATIERVGHWLVAVSFIILGLTGLALLYGRSVLIPVLGKEAFASIAMTGKLLHNYIAFSFMAGLAMIFVAWVKDNIPHPRDLEWVAKGGGVLLKSVHPPAKKFNAGQKVVFWVVILGGISMSLSGLALMFPFEMPLFAKTFAALNTIGFTLPTNLSPVEEMQYSSAWHAIVALVLICVILAHIYIGSIGMEGAFDAMGSGKVDLNWAREHHGLWVEEVENKAPDKIDSREMQSMHPAE